MSKVSIAGDSSGTGTFTIKSPNSNTDRTLSLPDASGTVLAGTVGASVLNTVTNKIAVQINGTTYYLLATTSGL